MVKISAMKNVKKILKCCPYYDDIINSDIMYNDDLSIDLIEWYKDIIFSCNGDNEEDIKIIINNKLNELLNKYYKYNIKLTNNINEEILKECNYQYYGARKIEKVIQNKLENIIIDNIINNNNDIYIDSIFSK